MPAAAALASKRQLLEELLRASGRLLLVAYSGYGEHGKGTLYIDYKSGGAKEYPNAHDVAISPAGVLTLRWQAEGSKKLRAYKFTTSVPFTVEEVIAVG